MKRGKSALLAGVALLTVSAWASGQSRLNYAQPNARTPVDAFNDGVRQGQEQRQRELDHQAQLEYLRGQQRLKSLSAEFWASDDARKWEILPQIAAIDPVLAAQYQASMPAPTAATSSVVYRCDHADGSVEFTAVPADGCTVISANPGQ